MELGDRGRKGYCFFIFLLVSTEVESTVVSLAINARFQLNVVVVNIRSVAMMTTTIAREGCT